MPVRASKNLRIRSPSTSRMGRRNASSVRTSPGTIRLTPPVTGIFQAGTKSIRSRTPPRSEREFVSLRNPRFRDDDSSAVAYVNASAGLEEPTDSIAVDLEDGQTQRFQRADFAGDDTAHPASDRNLPGRYKEYSLEDAAVGDLLLRWQGTDVTAASARDGEQQWQAELPGEAVWFAVGESDTAVVVAQALPGRNPFVPASSDDRASIGSYLTVLDGHS